MSYSERILTEAGAEQMLILKDKAMEYIDLLVKLSSDLPFYGKSGTLDYPTVDHFIKKYSPNYLGKDMQVQTVATILDAEIIRRRSVSLKESEFLSEYDKKSAAIRFDRATEVLENSLRAVYSDGNRTTEDSFDDLYSDFFSSNRMVEINKAMEIRRKWFDSHNHFGDLKMTNTDYYCGDLTASGI